MAPERGLVTYVSAVSKMISEEPERAVIIPAFNGEGTVKSVVNSVKRVTTSSVRPSIIIQPTARRQRPHRQVLASSDCQSSWVPSAPFRLASGKRLGKVAAASLLWILMGNTTHAIWSN